MNIKKTANLLLNFTIRRLAEIFGVLISLIGGMLFIALITYSPNDPNFIKMKNVNAFFYFKDDTVLEVFSEKGIYNNKTLDMNFSKNVKAIYEGSTLTSQKAEYSNSNNFLQISENVKVDDIRGNFTAEKLYFDISKQTLNIASSKKGKINANINIK